jgi:hypothetical protein
MPAVPLTVIVCLVEVSFMYLKEIKANQKTSSKGEGKQKEGITWHWSFILELQLQTSGQIE